MPFVLLRLAALVLPACDDGAAPQPDDTAQTLTIAAPTKVDLGCYSTDLTVTVTGGAALGWELGFARPSYDWLDEACLTGDDVCHSLGVEGGVIQQSGSSCDDPSDGQSCIPGGFHYAGVMTYVLKASGSERCWVWGDDVDHYDALGCERPEGWAEACEH